MKLYMPNPKDLTPEEWEEWSRTHQYPYYGSPINC